MEYEKDFVKEEVVELQIKDKPGFKYKPTTAGEENDWLQQYTYRNERNKLVEDLSMLNKCKMRNLVGVPYDDEAINSIIGIRKNWNELTIEQKWSLISKLKPSLFNEIILAMNRVDNPEDDKKKD